MGHIDWARWADLILLCPASAQMINSLATGTGQGIICDIFLANNFLKPYWIIPAMNSQMYLHPATQDSIKKLKSWGVNVLETVTGELACGEYGEGRMLEPEIIFNRIQNQINNRNLNVIVTAGGTNEPIDGVRSISNSSTGETGNTIAQHLWQNGVNVFLVRSHLSMSPHLKNEFVFKTSADLEKILKDLLSNKKFDYIVHAAAVSDFIIDKISSDGQVITAVNKKLNSSEEVTLKLKKANKIIDKLKEYSLSKDIKIIGFKLTNSDNKKENLSQVLKLSTNPVVDYVVHNDLSNITPQQHINELYKKDRIIFKGKTKKDLAHNLYELMRSEHDTLS